MTMGEAATEKPVDAAAAAPAPGEVKEPDASQMTSGVEIVQGEGKENSGLTAAEWTSMEQMDVSTANTHRNL